MNLDVVLGELGGSRRFDLSVPISADTPLTPHMVPFRMAYVRRHGDVVRDGDVSGSTEMISMGAHTGTHVDALAHISHRGRLHGGLPVDDVMVACQVWRWPTARMLPSDGSWLELSRWCLTADAGRNAGSRTGQHRF